MPLPPFSLVLAAKQTLHLTNQEMAQRLGMSLRTFQRNIATGGLRDDEDVETLVRAVHPKDPALAAKLAQASGRSVEAMGLVPAATRPASSHDGATGCQHPILAAARSEHADAVVYAAADALEVAPGAIRAAVAAAFTRAHELGVSLETLAPLLAAKAWNPQAKK